ncbi:MAG: strictosidine synthase [Nitratireductor sp.]|nr:strictosidine synthase [Nitratireductor sp.]
MAMFDWIFKARETATVPSMDGALRPNTALDDAEVLAEAEAPDNLVLSGASVLYSSGNGLFELGKSGGKSRSRPRAGSKALQRFESDVLALAAAPDGGLAIALKGKGIAVSGGAHDGTMLAGIGPKQLAAVTSMAFDGADTLIVSIGSEKHDVGDWQRDLLELGESGSVWRIPLGGGDAQCIAQNLRYPSGVLCTEGSVVISEAWRHRLIAISADKPNTIRVLLDDLPGYPGRLSARGRDGAWLSVFAPRSQLVEFVLREDLFRRHMMEMIGEEYWIAPALRAGKSYKEPMQVGAVKTLGVHKPWAPSRSYGLAVRLGPDLMPVTSLHSRADGHRHGVTSCLEHQGRVIVTCRGDDVVVATDAEQERGGAA